MNCTSRSLSTQSFIFFLLSISKLAQASGYKDVEWGTSCGDAIASLEEKGMTFDEGWKKMALNGETGDPGPASLSTFLAGSCSGLDTAQATFGHEYPYSSVLGWVAGLETNLFCRDRKFVAITFSADLDNSDKAQAILGLRQIAGTPISTRRVGLNMYFGIQYVQFSILPQKSDSVRFLVTHLNHYSQEREIRYWVVSKSEYDLITKGKKLCNEQQTKEERSTQQKNKKAREKAIE